MRGIPIFTFINKLDRPAMPPLDLIDQIEKVLGMHACPVSWPLESGVFFKGVYDRVGRAVHLYEKVPGGAYRAPVSVHDITDPPVREILSETSYRQIIEEIEMLDVAHEGLDLAAVHGHLAWRFNTQTHLVAANFHYNNCNVIVDDDALVLFARKY